MSAFWVLFQVHGWLIIALLTPLCLFVWWGIRRSPPLKELARKARTINKKTDRCYHFLSSDAAFNLKKNMILSLDGEIGWSVCRRLIALFETKGFEPIKDEPQLISLLKEWERSLLENLKSKNTQPGGSGDANYR